MISLTPSQNRLFKVIRFYYDKHGIAPSFDEMMIGIAAASRGHLHRLILQLEARGKIQREPGRKRSLVIVGYVRPAPATQPEAVADRIIERLRANGDLQLSAMRGIIIDEVRSLNEVIAAQ
jgi:SOS-response transcriptional repressor LexA